MRHNVGMRRYPRYQNRYQRRRAKRLARRKGNEQQRGQRPRQGAKPRGVLWLRLLARAMSALR